MKDYVVINYLIESKSCIFKLLDTIQFAEANNDITFNSIDRERISQAKDLHRQIKSILKEGENEKLKGN